MQISIAMTVRNNERFLPRLLDSLARQTRLPLELVAHDDASDDGTAAILERFAREAPFEVRIERSPARRGAAEGAIRAAAMCRGELIAYCDSDDVWLDHKLDACHEALARSGAELTMHATRVVDAELRELASRWPAIERDRLVPRLGLTGLAVDAPGMAMVYRRRVVHAAQSARRPPSRYGGSRMLHDEWVLFLAGVLGPVRLVAEPLALYRQHDANDSEGAFERERRTTLRPLLEDYTFAADHYAACSDYLASTGADDPALAERLRDGAEYYRRTAEAWRLRVELYGARGRRSRARIVRRLVAADAYRPTAAGGFGRRALGKDVVGAVAIGMKAAGRERDA